MPIRINGNKRIGIKSLKLIIYFFSRQKILKLNKLIEINILLYYLFIYAFFNLFDKLIILPFL